MTAEDGRFDRITARIEHRIRGQDGSKTDPSSCRRGRKVNASADWTRTQLVREDPMADMIISKSKTKSSVSKCNVSGDFYEALDKKVRELIKGAEDRAVANGRKTVRPYDI